MKRLLRIRLTLLLFALAAIPLATLPFVERIRDEWRRRFEPKPAVALPLVYVDYEVTFAFAEPEVVWDFEDNSGCVLTIDLDLSDHDAILEIDPLEGLVPLAIEPGINVHSIDCPGKSNGK